MRYIYTYLLLTIYLLITTNGYSQKVLRITTDEQLQKEQGEYQHQFYIEVDSVAYQLKYIDSNKYIVPQKAIDNIDSGEIYYIYFETEKRYYWSVYKVDVTLITAITFTGAFKKYKWYTKRSGLLPISYRVSTPTYGYFYRGEGLCGYTVKGTLRYKNKNSSKGFVLIGSR